MKLRECPWWPRFWRPDITTEQVSNDGIFETCELLKRDLIIEVDYSGRTVVGRIEDSLNAPNLERVRNFLLDYCDEPMEKIEDLDVTPDQFKRR